MPVSKPAEVPLQEVVPEPVVEPTRPSQNGCEPILRLIEQYDWNVQIAKAIVQAESGCAADAVGDTSPINGLLAHSCGAFQIRSLKGRPTCEQLKDPATNVEWAYKISAGGNDWRPWSVYQSGKYLKHM